MVEEARSLRAGLPAPVPGSAASLSAEKSSGATTKTGVSTSSMSATNSARRGAWMAAAHQGSRRLERSLHRLA